MRLTWCQKWNRSRKFARRVIYWVKKYLRDKNNRWLNFHQGRTLDVFNLKHQAYTNWRKLKMLQNRVIKKCKEVQPRKNFKSNLSTECSKIQTRKIIHLNSFQHFSRTIKLPLRLALSSKFLRTNTYNKSQFIRLMA